jgi:hypothetical protein
VAIFYDTYMSWSYVEKALHFFKHIFSQDAAVGMKYKWTRTYLLHGESNFLWWQATGWGDALYGPTDLLSEHGIDDHEIQYYWMGWPSSIFSGTWAWRTIWYFAAFYLITRYRIFQVDELGRDYESIWRISHIKRFFKDSIDRSYGSKKICWFYIEGRY